jgi:uncharacterized membrane protein
MMNRLGRDKGGERDWRQRVEDALNEQRLVPGLTWFSLGLGIAQLAAPGWMAKLVGVRDNDDARLAMRLVGVREVACGVGLMSGCSPASMVGSRVGGDIVDLMLLGRAMRGRRVNRGQLAAATAMVLGVTAVDVIGTLKTSRDGGGAYGRKKSDRLTRTTRTIVVNRSPDEVYQFWLNFENFPRFMKHLESVKNLGGGRSHWKARGPAGQTFEWDAEVVENRPNELLTWRSLPGADVQNAGSVRFERAPGGRGTLVRVNLRYEPPAGSAGKVMAMLLGAEPGQEVQEDLRRFKQVLETGEVVRSDASIHERPHPARPPERPIPLQPPLQTLAPFGQSTRSSSTDEPGWPEPDEQPAQRSSADEATGATTGRGSR